MFAKEKNCYGIYSGLFLNNVGNGLYAKKLNKEQ